MKGNTLVACQRCNSTGTIFVTRPDKTGKRERVRSLEVCPDCAPPKKSRIRKKGSGHR